jgi:oligopeptide/dipeptide ABC transporter ATP-binding protein
MTAAVLSVRDLSVEFPTDDGLVRAVDTVSFDVSANQTLGIVGESGSGKSVTSLAIMGLLPKSARITGEVFLNGESLLTKSDREMREVRGKRIAMVFQDALAALNPVYKVGRQITEAIQVHQDLNDAAARSKAIELLDIVGIPEPARRYGQYPHEFSGGMRQRAMIAMSLANDPEVLIADEPTTALDVTIQAQVLEVFDRIQTRTNSALLLITHDLGVVAGVADQVMVMYAGRQVEYGTVDDIFYRTGHPYAQGLLASLPRLDKRAEGERLFRIKGQPPSVIHLPPGCAFAPRCEFAKPGLCDTRRPELVEIGVGHTSACLRADDIMVREGVTS